MNNNNIIDDWQTNQEKQLYRKIEVRLSQKMVNDLSTMFNIDIEFMIKNAILNETNSSSHININYE